MASGPDETEEAPAWPAFAKEHYPELFSQVDMSLGSMWIAPKDKAGWYAASSAERKWHVRRRCGNDPDAVEVLKITEELIALYEAAKVAVPAPKPVPKPKPVSTNRARRREYKSSSPAIIEAARRLGKRQEDYETFEGYRRALCAAAKVAQNARGWSEDSVRNALKPKVPKVPKVK